MIAERCVGGTNEGRMCRIFTLFRDRHGNPKCHHHGGTKP